MNEILVVGGQQKSKSSGNKEWSRYSNGLILKVNLDTGKIQRMVEYTSPPEVVPSNPSIVFKAGTLKGDRLYLVTQTEILIYQLPDFKLTNYISHQWFNDVHHVYPTEDHTLLVANTGLDQVLELNEEGRVLNQWNTVGENTWERFDQDQDYRVVPTTKPHHSHPNYVFKHDNEIWVTRFYQKDAYCLTDPTKRIAIDIESPHDGRVHHHSIYFTTINGCIVKANMENHKLEEIIDLNTIHQINKSLGWTRGLAVLDDEHILVGFSRIRPTKIKENLKWLRYKLRLTEVEGSLPTRVAIYNIKKKALVKEFPLEAFDLNAVFSIHPLN